MPREGEEKETCQEITRKKKRKKKKKKQNTKEEGLVPKGDHVPKGTLDVNEAEEWNGSLLRNGKDHQKPP